MWGSKSPWILNALIVLSACVMFSALAVMFFSAGSVTQKHVSLVQAVHRIELQATLAHLSFEEAVRGDPSIQIEDVYARIVESQRAVQLILEGGRSEQGKMKSLEASELRDDVAEVQANLKQFQQIAEQRWNNIKQSRPGSEIDQEYDTIYDQFLSSTNKINESLNKHIAADSQTFRTLSVVLLGIACAVILGATVLVNYLLTCQHKTKYELLALNQHLQADEQQLRANEQQLNAAGQQLRAANQQLRASESQLLAYNKQLLAINQKLSDSEDRFRLLMRESPAVIEIYDRHGTQVTVNKAYETLWGFPAEHTVGIFNLFKSDAIKQTGLLDYINRAYAGESVTVPEYEYDAAGNIPGSGLSRKRWLYTRIYPIQNNNGDIENIVIMHEDMTEQKRQEAEMLKLIADQNIILEHDQSFIIYKDIDNNILRVSSKVAEMTGLPREEIEGKPSAEIYPNMADKYYQDDLEVIQSGQKRLGIIEPLPTVDGRTKWLLTHKVPVKDDSGQVTGIVVFSMDITELKEAEIQLAQNEERFRLIYEQLPLGYQSLDETGRFVEVNPKWLSMMGYAKQEVLWKRFEDFMPDSYRLLFHERFKCFMEAGEVRSADFQMIRKDGTLIDVEIDGMVGRNPDGSIKQTHCILNDMTDRKRVERDRQKLMRMLESKNEELQSIVHVSSHDLKTPLVNISGFGTLLEKHCNQLKDILRSETMDPTVLNAVEKLLEEDIPEDLGFITQSAGKMNALINGLLEVSRAGSASLNITRLDMNQLIQSIIANSAFKAQQIRAEVTLDPLGHCMGDPSQISQVFMNLIDNSLKYAHPSRNPRIHISCTTRDDETIYCVGDNGIGIKPEYHEKIFEIFHRLDPKSTADGEGLGLAIIRRILDRHNGKVWLESVPDEGSKFYVSLPNKEQR